MKHVKRIKAYEGKGNKQAGSQDAVSSGEVTEQALTISADLLSERFIHEIDLYAAHVLSGAAAQLAARIGAAIGRYSAQQQQSVEALPVVRRRASKPHKQLRKVALAGRAQGHWVSKAAARKVKRHTGSSSWWYNLTDAQKQAIIDKRVAGNAKVVAARRKEAA